jgi:hypothetical protein
MRNPESDGGRTYFIWKAMLDTYDETWYSYPLWIAAAIEVQLGVVRSFFNPEIEFDID